MASKHKTFARELGLDHLCFHKKIRILKKHKFKSYTLYYIDYIWSDYNIDGITHVKCWIINHKELGVFFVATDLGTVKADSQMSELDWEPNIILEKDALRAINRYI